MSRLSARRGRWSIAGLVVLALGLGAQACTEPLPRLAHTVESPEALAQAVLDRIAAGDQAGLDQLLLTRDEFEAHVWPHLPVSRPETNMPMAFVWNRLQQQSRARLAQTLAAHRGVPYTFVAVTFAGERTVYGEVVVTRDSVITVRAPDGREEQLALFGSMIAQDGHCKVFSYVSD